MTLAEKIWGSSIGAFIAYGKTAAAAALKPLLVSDNGDGTGTLVVSAASSALPTGAATSAKQASTQITEYNITLTLADTEYSQALPANTKKIEFWSRNKYAFRHAFTAGKVAGLASPYLTAFANSNYESPGMADLTSKTIYFATDSAGDVIEMRVWS